MLHLLLLPKNSTPAIGADVDLNLRPAGLACPLSMSPPLLVMELRPWSYLEVPQLCDCCRDIPTRRLRLPLALRRSCRRPPPHCCQTRSMQSADRCVSPRNIDVGLAKTDAVSPPRWPRRLIGMQRAALCRHTVPTHRKPSSSARLARHGGRAAPPSAETAVLPIT